MEADYNLLSASSEMIEVWIDEPREDEKGVTYETVRAAFEEIAKNYKDRYIRNYKACDPKVGEESLHAAGVGWSTCLSMFAFIGCGLGAAFQTSMGPYGLALLAIPPVPVLAYWSAIGVREVALRVFNGKAESQIEQIDAWISGGNASRSVPANQLKLLAEGVSQESRLDLNISQARALKKRFPKNTLPDALQILWEKLDKVHDLQVNDLITVIKSEGFEKSMLDDYSFIGEYVRELDKANVLEEVMQTLKTTMKAVFKVDIGDYALVIRELAKEKRLEHAFDDGKMWPQQDDVPFEDKDVILRFGNREINASREVLSSFSDVFRSMLKGRYQESKQKIVPIYVEGVDAEVMEDVIEYVHGDAIKFNINKCRQYLKIAQQFQLDVIKNSVEQQLIEKLKDIELDVAAINSFLNLIATYNLPNFQQSLKKAAEKTRGDYLVKLEKSHRNISNKELIKAVFVAKWGKDELECVPPVLFSKFMDNTPDRLRKWFADSKEGMHPNLKALLGYYVEQNREQVARNWFAKSHDIETYQSRLTEYDEMAKIALDYHAILVAAVDDLATDCSMLKSLVINRKQLSKLAKVILQQVIERQSKSIIKALLDNGKSVTVETLRDILQLFQEEAEQNLQFQSPHKELLEEFLQTCMLKGGNEESPLLKMLWETGDLQAEFKDFILEFCKNNQLICQKTWKVLPPAIDQYIIG